MPKLTYIDLFAGCGGMSLGLEQAGFELVLAVEKSPMAAETFYHNLIEGIVDTGAWKDFSGEHQSVLSQAKKKLVVKELSAVLECKELLQQLRKDSIDLVAGGPPCQGFSLAGRRNPEDSRNRLAWEFLEFVEAVQPRAVIIENVSGMNQQFRKHGKASPFGELTKALEGTGPGYEVQPVLLNAMHYGAPQHRPRLMLLGLRTDIARRLGLHFNEQLWKSEYDDPARLGTPVRPDLAPKATHLGEEILTAADAIADIDGNGYKNTTNLTAFASEMRQVDVATPSAVAVDQAKRRPLNHVLRRHNPRIMTRFRLYQLLRDSGVSSNVLAIPKVAETSEDVLWQLVSEAVSKVRFPAKAPDGTKLATNKPQLVDLIMSLGTKKHSQRPLSWGQPSPTIVSLPDDYVHPEEARTLTVRECARFQSFPDWFEFRAKETTGSMRRRYEVPQYTQVGNAVPPKMAKAVGCAIANLLDGARPIKKPHRHPENEPRLDFEQEVAGTP
jgi:DNA (cytosine-5)-methyltransferase 1